MKHHSLLIVGNFLSQASKTRSVCEDLAERLTDSGWSVITTSSRKPRAARLMDMLSTIWKKRNEYEIAQVDVYSGRAFLWAEASCWTLRQARKDYVLTLHGGNLPEFSRKHPERVRKLLNSAIAVTSPSLYLAEMMSQYRQDLHLLPNPIDVNAFSYRMRKDPHPRLVWLRAFHRIYNPQLAVRALALLTQDFPEIQLIMGGPDKDGVTLKEFRETAEMLKVWDRIEISGSIQRNDIGAFLNRGDIFLNTTFFDNTPVSVMEAMACGLCIVSTNVGGIPKLLEHEKDALLVPPDDHKAMAAAVSRVLTESEVSSKISAGARSKVENFDWSQILPKWQSLFVTCLNQTQITPIGN